jgi:hypothetical protein
MAGYIDPSQITPGALTPAAQSAFLHGACAALAIALHDATNWPVVMVTDAWNVSNGIAGGGSALHWLVHHPSGRLVDVDGFHTADDLTAEYEGYADDGEAAIGTSSREDAAEWYEAQGEPVSLDLAATFVPAVLSLLD